APTSFPNGFADYEIRTGASWATATFLDSTKKTNFLVVDPTSSEDAFLFNGSTGEVTLPLVTNATANVTLEAWIKLPASPTGFIINVGTSANGYGLGTNGLALQALYNGVTFINPTGGPTLVAGQWYHVALVIGAAATAPTFYVNGVAYAGATSS